MSVLLPRAVATIVLARGAIEVARWISGNVKPDLSAIDRLARLQLEARRLGYRVQVVGPRADLTRLIDLVGLRGVLD